MPVLVHLRDAELVLRSYFETDREVYVDADVQATDDGEFGGVQILKVACSYSGREAGFDGSQQERDLEDALWMKALPLINEELQRRVRAEESSCPAP